MTVDEAGQLVSCSMDDTVRYTNLSLRDYRSVLLGAPRPPGPCACSRARS